AILLSEPHCAPARPRHRIDSRRIDRRPGQRHAEANAGARGWYARDRERAVQQIRPLAHADDTHSAPPLGTLPRFLHDEAAAVVRDLDLQRIRYSFDGD